jgi:methyl-accepting chemotaxis protein
MAGNAILGELVVSRSTGKSSGIVAVPIRGSDGTIVGALGASIYLDRLSAQLEREMNLDPSMIFYSFDAQPLLGLVWDASLIMADPHRLSSEVGAAFDEMRTKREGIQTYAFRGKQRTVVFRRSERTGWWYAFGIVPEGRQARAATRAHAAGSARPETTSL